MWRGPTSRSTSPTRSNLKISRRGEQPSRYSESRVGSDCSAYGLLPVGLQLGIYLLGPLVVGARQELSKAPRLPAGPDLGHVPDDVDLGREPVHLCLRVVLDDQTFHVFSQLMSELVEVRLG